MNRIQIACYCLSASAIFLTGLLVGTLGYNFATNAKADMVIAQQNFSLMTAQTRNEEEGLFVLDNKSGRLLIYRMNLPRKQFELKAGLDLQEAFNIGPRGGQNPRQRGGRGR